MLNVIIKSKGKISADNFGVSVMMPGKCSSAEIKATIIAFLKGCSDSTDELVVLEALEQYTKERLAE